MRRPVTVFVSAVAGLLLSGCSSARTAAPGRNLDPATPKTAFRSATVTGLVTPPPAVSHLTLAWECTEHPLDGSLTTGIEASADLCAWHVAASWPLVTVSNTWSVTCAQPAEFYRAFIR